MQCPKKFELMLTRRVKAYSSSCGNRQPVYDFLLVINSNLGPISHRYLAKNRKLFTHPSHLAPSFGVTPFEYIEKLYGS